MSTVAIVYIVVILILFVLSAFFSCVDMAYSAVNVRRLKVAAKKGSKAAKQALDYANHYEKTIVTVLFGNSLVNILATSLGAALSLQEPFSANPASATIISLVLFVLILTFGEILPKAIAKANSYRLALLSVYPLRFFELIFYPIVFSVTKLATMITKPFLKRLPGPRAASDEELQAMVDQIEEEGLIDESQSELISNSLEFKDTCAYEVMTPRMKIEGISDKEDLNRYVLQEGAFRHSRIPVYHRHYDSIIGYIPVKSLQKAIINGKKLEFSSLMLPILDVPRTMEISSILRLMKKSRHHIAVVKDEYGGTEGILTLEDILEELVGEMWDESEAITVDIAKTEKRNEYLVKGNTDIHDFFEQFALDEKYLDEDYETVSGWINDRLGRFARKGDVFDFQKVTVKVKKANAYTVLEAEVTYHPRRKV